MEDNNSKSAKADWTSKRHEVWVEICYNLVKKGRRPHKVLDKTGYEFLIKEFHKRTGVYYDKGQMKNKWDRQKGIWGRWNKICTNIDISYDVDTGILDASDEWWDGWLKHHPKDTIFRKQPLNFAKQLDFIFGGTYATGSRMWSPASGTMPSTSAPQDENLDEDDIDDVMGTQHPESQTLLQFTSDDDEFEDDATHTVIPPIDSTRRRSGDTLQSQSRKQKMTTAMQICQSLEMLADAVHSQISASTNPTHVKKGSIQESIELLDQLSDLTPKCALYRFALKMFMKNKQFREVFCALRSAEVRLGWLEYEMSDFMAKKDV